ncbi:hypothetical protein EZV73_01700 [Acidaminobacter sp. JC074]|uniref:hypothetical protein n=1 Tax=Acidaminobacter sp. JC074 TaxID=2530199 RepID=UPI001F0D3E82|nr:hypothetical protein [Acidaminobacter sp. JC074]MCH4886259.1 hypothetical protein [Acidaminobacter sp. JC074]
MAKNKKWIVLIIVLVISYYSFDMIMPIIRQEDHVGKIILSGFKVIFTNQDMVKYHEDDSGAYYLTRTENSHKLIKDYMEEKDWIFKEQAGSGFIFIKENSDNTLVVSTRQFTRFFRIWYMPTNDD